MSAVADQVRDLLAQLGDTPDQVADRLRALGIKGERYGNCCPVANYLASEVPACFFRVYEHGVAIYKAPYVSAYDRADVPGPVERFIRRFDEEHGPYLDLVEVAS